MVIDLTDYLFLALSNPHNYSGALCCLLKVLVGSHCGPFFLISVVFVAVVFVRVDVRSVVTLTMFSTLAPLQKLEIAWIISLDITE